MSFVPLSFCRWGISLKFDTHNNKRNEERGRSLGLPQSTKPCLNIRCSRKLSSQQICQVLITDLIIITTVSLCRGGASQFFLHFFVLRGKELQLKFSVQSKAID